MTVLVPNLTGILVGGACTYLYSLYNPTTSTTLYLTGSIVMLLTFYFAAEKNYQYVGTLGCALAVIVMGAPLATLRTVITEKSTASLPFWTSIFGWLNSLSWLSYGILIVNDPMVRYYHANIQ